MNAVDLYTRCDAAFRDRLAAVDGRWAAPTALPGWDVRALVHHMVVEERWAPPLFAGLTIDEVGDIFEGDQLVPDPLTRRPRRVRRRTGRRAGRGRDGAHRAPVVR